MSITAHHYSEKTVSKGYLKTEELYDPNVKCGCRIFRVWSPSILRSIDTVFSEVEVIRCFSCKVSMRDAQSTYKHILDTYGDVEVPESVITTSMVLPDGKTLNITYLDFREQRPGYWHNEPLSYIMNEVRSLEIV